MMKKQLLFGIALLACVGGGEGAASALSGNGDDNRVDAGSRALEFGSARGTERISASTRPNSGPPWTVLAYETRTGKKCAAAGQMVGGRVGRVDARDNRFRALDLDEVPCSDLDNVPAGYAVNPRVTGFSEVEGGDVTLVWGTVERNVRHIVVTRSGDQSTRRLTPTREGTFITAYAGNPLPDTLTVEAVRADGTSKAYDFEPLRGVPDPEEIRREAAEHEAAHSGSSR
jgi:hypothetical protein